MTKKIILITDRIDDPFIEKEILGSGYEFLYLPDLTPEAANDALRSAFALLVWHYPINLNIVTKLENCKAVIRYGAGTDNLDIDSLKRAGIKVGYCPDYGVDEVADSTVAMILHFVRNISESQRANLFSPGVWGRPSHRGLRRTSHHTLGIVGLGKIGTAVGLRMKSFGMGVGFYDPYVSPGLEKSLQMQHFDSLEDLLRASSIVTLHCPLDESTRGLVDERFLAAMQSGTILINTARGGLIKDLALVASALEKGHLSALGMDVLPHEPPETNDAVVREWVSADSSTSSQVLLTPHIAYFSDQAIEEIRRKAATSILMVAAGGNPLYEVH